MEKSNQTRIIVVLLALFTVAAAVFASFNFVQESNYQSPTDGVWWLEARGGLEAQRVTKGGPGERAGLKAGDLLVAANGAATPRWASLTYEMIQAKVYNTITYTIMRNGVRLEVPVILDATDRSFNQGFRLIALVYLGIGLYVLFRRWTAPHATHFFIFCLVSFVLYSFKYTGKLNGLDQIIYWGNIVAEALQPALFLHFALAFSEEQGRQRPLAGGAGLSSRRFSSWAFASWPSNTGRRRKHYCTALTSFRPATWPCITCWPPSFCP